MYSTSSAWWRFLSRCCVWGLLAGVASGVAAAEVGADERARLDEKLGRVEIPFVANVGLTDPAVAFSAPTFAGTAFVTRRGQIVYSLASGAKGSPGWTLTETPVNSGPLAPVGEEPSETRVSYFLGDDPARWRPDVETYRSVSLGRAWPGVSLLLRAYGNSIEKLFTVEPGADASRIRMRVDGAKSLRLDRDGALLLATGLGQVRFTAPVAFQEKGGVRHPVSVAYRVEGSRYGFVLGDYDPGVAVVIDPLLQATYLGGSGMSDLALALAIHPTSGEVYVAGGTDSTNFPGTAGGAQPAFGGGSQDAFVALLNASLTTLAQATYLGGSFGDFARAVAIHPTSGEVYVAGETQSTNFPGTAGGAQPAFGGGVNDAFVARLTTSLTTLPQASYLGGSGGDRAFDLAIHPTSGEVYVAGQAGSTNFPGTAGGAQPASGGGNDGFVARLAATLTSLAQASYLGGSGTDLASALAIHPTSGQVYVAGQAGSTNFPGTAGGAQPASGGGNDAFVVRLTASLTTLAQATYLGGSFGDDASALAIHPTSGEVYVAGETFSPNFPGTAGGAQPAYGGNTDAFVARLTASLTTLAQATYLGGSSGDFAFALAIHPTSGEVYMAGQTQSTNFPGTAGGAQPAFGGSTDAFVARLTASLTTLAQASYLGGSGTDLASALAVHPTSGEVYVAGGSSSANFPGTAGGAQPALNGFSDALVARLTADLAGGQTGFFTVNPCRVSDTRDPADGPALSSGTERLFQIEGECGIPTTATAVSANITITEPTAEGFLSVYPGGTLAPLPISTINFRPGQTRANNAIVPLGVVGNIAIIYGTVAPGTVHVIIDVNGYFE